MSVLILHPAFHEKRTYKRQFAMSLANMAHLRIYWSPTTRRIYARRVNAKLHFPLLPDAHLVGTYTHPFNGDDFLGDLDDLIAKLNFPTAAVEQRAAAV